MDRVRGRVVMDNLDRKDVVGGAEFTIGDESTDIINVAIQLQDEAGNDIDFKGVVDFWLSSDSDGDTLASAASALAIGTDGTILVEYTSNILGKVVSEADGDIDINITDSETATYYLNIGLPSGKYVTSDAITFST